MLTLQLLRDKDVAQLLSIGKSTVWLYASNGTLPKPTKLSDRVSVWKLSDIEAFIASRLEV